MITEEEKEEFLTAKKFVSRNNFQKAVIMLILSSEFQKEFKKDPNAAVNRYNLWVSADEMTSLGKLAKWIDDKNPTLKEINKWIKDNLHSVIPQTVVIRT